MRINKTVLFLAAALLGGPAGVFAAEPYKLNIVFVGDSITYGYLLSDPQKEAPPVQTVAWLKEQAGVGRVQMKNCGRNGYRSDQFLPEAVDSAWPLVQAAGTAFQKDGGTLVFSMMLGANDSALATHTPEKFGQHLASLVALIITNFPSAQVVIHHPIFLSKVPSSHPERLKTYCPVIDEQVTSMSEPYSKRVFVGDTKAWNYFAEHHQTLYFEEIRDRKPYYVHPNKQGSVILGAYWGKAIYETVVCRAGNESARMVEEREKE